jgi:hypothetical protein
MILLAAWWGLGYAALLVATITLGWHTVRSRRALREGERGRTDRATWLSGQILLAIGTVMLWVALLSRATNGHGWPFVSPADAATGIALLTLLIHLFWGLFSGSWGAGYAVGAIALMLLSYGLGRQPQGLTTAYIGQEGVLLSSALGLCGGSLLALASATSLSRQLCLLWFAGSRESHHEVSAALVRAALLCLALNLAVDTWWLQKVGLGNENDAQQAGIAIAWMVYFVALRLRASPRWRGWPWTAVLIVGFVCTLPILIDVPWLESTLPI